MSAEGNLAHDSKIYSQFSNLYDHIFGKVFFPRIARVLGAMNFPPDTRVLEVGVGTGLALPAYPSHCRLVGLDLALPMIQRARRKAAEGAWTHVELSVGDAQCLPFPDRSFDCVTSFHVVSVVPDAGAMMREMARVCRPGGRLVIINHFRSPRPLLAAAVDRLDPLTRKLGWRTTLEPSELLAGVELEDVRRFKVSPSSLFTVVIARLPGVDEPLRATA